MQLESGPSVRVLRVELAPRTLLFITLMAGAVWAVFHLWPVLVVIISALMFAGALGPAVGWLEQRRFRRPLALATVFSVSTAVLVVLALVTLPALWAELGQALLNLPATQEKLAHVLEAHRNLIPLAASVRNYHLAQSSAAPGTITSVASVSLSAVKFIGYGATAVVLALYLMTDHERMKGALFAVTPRRFHLRLARILLNLGTIVGGYIRGQLITSLAFSFFVFAVLTVTRVPHALGLAALSGILDVVPFVGGFVAIVPAAFAALPRGFGVVAAVVLLMFAYQEFESRFLVPRIYGTTLRLPSVLVVIALLAGGHLAGIAGALLALPAASALLMLVEELRLEMPGDDSDDRETRERDARAEEIYAQRTAGNSAQRAAKVAAAIAVERGT